MIFSLFFLWRIVDFLIIFLAGKFIPYLGFFPYKDILDQYQLPFWLKKLANFDGVHYLLIAKNGYSQWQQAFFPLYSILIRIINIFINNYLLTGLLVSNISFLVGLYFLKKTFEKDLGKNILYLIVFLLVFPTSFYFGALYTEGLFFLFFSLFIYFLKKNKFHLAAIASFFASLTRLIGVFLVVFLIINLFYLKTKKTIKLPLLITYLFFPILGLSLYCFYLWQTTGDPLMFLNAQPAFGANRSTHLIFLPQVIWRYIKIFFTANHNFQYFVSLFEFFIFWLIFILIFLDLKNLLLIKNLKFKIKNYFLFSLSVFSFINIILPTLTGTFSSIPRYSLFSLSTFVYLANLKNKLLKLIIIFLFLIFHILALGFFSQGYFVS